MMPDDFANGLLGLSIGGLIGTGLQVAYQFSDKETWRKLTPVHHGLVGMIVAPIGLLLGQPGVTGFGIGLFISDIKDFGKYSIGGD